MKKLSKRIIQIAVASGMIIMTILLLIMSFKTADTTQEVTDKAIDKISHFYIEEIAKNRASLISNELDKKYNYVNNALDIITQKDLESTKALRNYLGNMRKLFNMDTFALVDENCLVYTSHSTCSGKTRYPFLAEKITEPIYSTVLNYGGEKQLFLAVPVSGIYFNNSKITACFVEININQMMKSMTYRYDNMETYVNLYYKNGESLTNSDFGNIPAGINLLSAISAKEKDSKKIKKIINDFETGGTALAEIGYGEEEAHLFYIPVKNTGWILTILVYETAIDEQISSNIESLMQQTRTHVFFIFTLLFFLFIGLILIIRNVSHLKLQQEKIITQRTRLAYEKLNKETNAMQIIHSVLDSGPWRIEFDENGQILQCNWSDTFRKLLGFSFKEEFPNTLEAWSDRLHRSDKDAVLKAFWDTVNDTSGNTVYDVEYRLLTKNSGFKWYHAAGNIIRSSEGKPQTFVGLFTDIDENKRNEINLMEQFNIVNALSRDFANILTINLTTRTVKPIKLGGYIPESFMENYSADSSYDTFFTEYVEHRVYSEDKAFMNEAIALDTIIEKLNESDEYSSSYRIEENGDLHFYEFKYMKLNSDTIIVGIMNIDKIVNDAKEKQKLIVLSETDQMTGLLNRMSGELKVEDSLKKGNGGLFVLLDIDHFKSFNDTYGHDVGDKVIINVANCLKSAFREHDIVFRLGGDEYSAYAAEVHDKKVAESIIKRFIDNLKTIVIPEIEDKAVTASIGAIIIPQGEAADFGDNYKLIDKGVYNSKKINGSHVTFM
jgi:diguanylate cyclase (GGDEF)-like protein